jgi:hypothetical protein
MTLEQRWPTVLFGPKKRILWIILLPNAIPIFPHKSITPLVRIRLPAATMIYMDGEVADLNFE